MMHSKKPYHQLFIISVSFVSALGGYLFGFDFAVISGALPFLQKQFQLNAYWEGFLTGSLALGAMIGCVVAGAYSDRKGRRPALLLAALIFMFSSLAMAWAPTRMLFIGARLFAGIGVGMASVLSPMYIAEIAPSELRGRMVAINQLTIVIGILVTNLVNYSLRNNGDDAWRWMFGLGAVPAFLFFAGATLLPESPRWLFSNQREKDARKVLGKFGSTGYINEAIAGYGKMHQPNGPRSIKNIFEASIFPVVLTGSVLAVFQQFCGINVVFNYTAKIFESIGANSDNQLLQTVFIGAVNLVFSIVAMLLVDKLGRKPLMLIGSGGLAILYVIVAQLLHIGSAQVAWYLLSAIAIYAMSLAPVTWVLISEIFPTKIRSAATSFAVLCLWFAYFILIFSFPILFSKMKDNTFYIYAGICFSGFFFILFKVKESKGKSLEEVEDAFIIH